MRYRLFSFFFTFLISGILANAQQSVIDMTAHQGEIRNGYFIKKVPLQYYAKPQITISNTAYTQVSSSQKIKLPESNEVNVMLGKEFKKPFALLYIPALKEINGKTELLNSFRVTIIETPVENQFNTLAKTTTAINSVLATGDWYKIAIKEKGIYKIDYGFIKDKLGVDPATINPSNIRLYGNGGIMLSENNAVSRPQDLVENAIEVVGGSDGVFNSGDYILFYANGPTKWSYSSTSSSFVHEKNLYEDSSYYFLNFDSGSGLRIASQSSQPSATTTVSSYDDYQVHEEDLVNLGKYGKTFWGENIGENNGGTSSLSLTFSLGNIIDSASVKMHIGSKATVSGNTMAITLNGVTLGNYSFAALSGEYPAAIADNYVSYKLPVAAGTAIVDLVYSANGSGLGYLDYIEWNTRRQLSLDNGMITFRDSKSVGTSNVAAYTIQNANSNMEVWDITDPLQPILVNGSLSGSQYSFIQKADVLHDFVAFDGSNFYTPTFREKVANQNIHGEQQPDYLLVTYSGFINAANTLADYHRQKDGLNVLVLTTDQIYNEFNSGSQDISAIRDCAKYFYDNAADSSHAPRFLLLFGDASYDYKHRIASNTNFVPTFETAESENVLSGYCSDDFFSFLDDNENGENTNIANTMDISVGRIPVGSADEALKVVEKIMNYTSADALGPWRLSTTLMSDNGDGNIHFSDGEIMSATINDHSNLYNETKVYLSAIPTVSTPGGTRAPEANKMINDQIFKGTFLMNYNGHGSIYTLTSERILTQDDFNTWKNEDKLPIMVTATCDFSKYDDPEAQSAGEKLIVKTDGGAVALLTTTQLVYQNQNQIMNRQFLDALFQQYDGAWPTLGDAFRLSKNVTYISTGDMTNFRKFVLLGDPALKPAFPKYKVVTDGLYDGNSMQQTDSMKALGSYVLKGNVTDALGNNLTDFNGSVYVSIYDKARTESTITGPDLTFSVQNNIIFKGKATVTNGEFSISFITPKDLNYDYGKGKISYYVENGSDDGAGTDTTIVVGGFSDNPVADENGPEVKPYISDSLFMDGSITGSNTLLFVKLYDAETGINVSGNAIGHDLTAVLDGDVANPYILNDYYESAQNDYRRGYVNFPITGLSDGAHSITVKAWDMNNNSGEGVVNFIVVDGTVMQVQNLKNYPNPFSDKTYFVFDHNHPDEDLTITILIYNNTGSLVRTIKQNYTPDGSRSAEITWDGTNDNGAKLPSGLYVYRLNLSTEKGIQSSAYEKLILMR